MDMLKIAGLGVAGMLLALVLKDIRSQYAVYISLGACVLIAFYGVEKLKVVTDMVYAMQEYLTVKAAYLKILMKIAGISYLADFAANLCRDAGHSAIAGQIEVFGRISILALSSPILLALLEMVHSFLAYRP